MDRDHSLVNESQIPEMTLLKSTELQTMKEPRDGFRGGRTDGSADLGEGRELNSMGTVSNIISGQCHSYTSQICFAR